MLKTTKIFDFFFWSFIFLLLLLLNYSHGHLNADNGVFLSGAWSLINNLTIYKDFFSFTTPGTYYLILAVWKIFGVSYGAALVIALLTLLASAWLIYKITAQLNKQASYLAVTIFCLTSASWPIITSHVFCLPFILGAVYLIIIGLKKNKINLIYLAGLLSGIAVLFLQTIGLATILGLAVSLFWIYISKKNTISFKNLIGFIAFSIAPILILFLKWSPLFLFDKLIKFPLLNYSETISASYWLLSANIIFLFVFFFVLNKNRREDMVIKLLFILQIVLFLTTFSYPDFEHLIFISAPLIILFSVQVIEFIKNKLSPKFLLTFAISLSFIFYLGFYFIEAIVYLNYSDQPIIAFLNNNCHDKYIYAGPFLPEFYFETRKLNLGPSQWLLTNHHPEEYFLETAADLDRIKPDCAVVNYKVVAKFNYNKNNAVDNYLVRHYQEVKRFKETLILKRLTAN